jgi:hypothetical protein
MPCACLKVLSKPNSPLPSINFSCIPFYCSVLQLEDVKVIYSSLSFTLMMEVLRSSETTFLTRETRRHAQEDVFLHNHSRENIKSYTAGLCNGNVMCFLGGTSYFLSQTPAFFIVTAVKTSYLTLYMFSLLSHNLP